MPRAYRRVATGEWLGERGAEEAFRVARLAPAQGAEQDEGRPGRAARILRASSRPSISGMCMSRMAMSKASPASIQASASLGFAAALDCMPHLAVCRASTRRLVALSSTTSTRLPLSSGCTPTKSRARGAGSVATGATTVKWKWRPAPALALGHIRPPMSSARRREMASPSPCRRSAASWTSPPGRRTGRGAPCLRRDPDAVSRTARRAGLTAGRGLRRHRQHHFARVGELHGVGQEVQEICRRRVTSPVTAGGTSPSNR